MDYQFVALMSNLEAATLNDKVALLKQIAELFKWDQTSPQLAIVKSSNLIRILAEVMSQNKQQWLYQRQSWIYNMVLSIYSIMKFDIPLDHTKALIEVAVDYLKSTEDEFPPAILYAIAGRIDASISQILYDNNLLHKRMQALALIPSSASKAQCFYVQATAFDNWKMRLLEDEQFLLNLVAKPITDTWIIFSQLSKHSKAKEYIPKVVVQKASRVDDEWCPAICATLCDESDAAGLKMNPKFVEATAGYLEELLNSQDKKTLSHRSLFGLLFPLPNLSVGEANKEHLGKLFISLLKRTLQLPNNCANTMINNLKLGESKLLAAKVLRNLSSTEANRERIADSSGLAVIKRLHDSEAELTLKKELEGILGMFTPKKLPPTPVVELWKNALAASANQPAKPKDIDAWTSADILDWMKAEKIDAYYVLFMQHKMDGPALKHLKKQNNIVLLLKQIMDINTFGDLLHIDAAIQRL